MGRIGDPLEDHVLYGPLHSQQAVDEYKVLVSSYISKYIIYLYNKRRSPN